MSGIEKATAGPRHPQFPRSWGPAPHDEIERCAWIAVHTRARPLLPHVEVREHAPRRRVDPRLALLELRAKERPPA